ncbi:MAG TPA: hypothetical protein PKU96_01595 [bacterium]|nr:hypothetical protein [bacterium]HQC50271.1 hypothetical protein [bacterium]HQG12918.1 hypothetical protein [bacterium]
MKIKFYLVLFLAAVLAISSCGGASTSNSDTELPSGGGELLLISDAFGSDGIMRLKFGESFSFSVSYNGEKRSDFGCEILDADDQPVASGAGALVCEGGEGRFTAPHSVPTAGSYLKLRVSVRLLSITLQSDLSKSSGEVTADIEILLPCEYTSNCTAPSASLCMYSQCVAYSHIGVDPSQDSCDRDSACSGEEVCLSFDRDACGRRYCANPWDVFTLSIADCEEEGGVLVSPDDTHQICVTKDLFECISNDDDGHDDGHHDPGMCNDHQVESCHALSDEAECITSYYVSGINDLKYNCHWGIPGGEEGPEGCFVHGRSDDPDDACIGQ